MSIQNVEAEKTVLGSLLLDGELIKECHLTEQYFSLSVHKSIFQLMRKMEEEGQPIDLVTFISRIDPKFLEGIGGMEYFIALMDGVPTTANFSYYEGACSRCLENVSGGCSRAQNGRASYCGEE